MKPPKNRTLESVVIGLFLLILVAVLIGIFGA